MSTRVAPAASVTEIVFATFASRTVTVVLVGSVEVICALESTPFVQEAETVSAPRARRPLKDPVVSSAGTAGRRCSCPPCDCRSVSRIVPSPPRLLSVCDQHGRRVLRRWASRELSTHESIWN